MLHIASGSTLFAKRKTIFREQNTILFRNYNLVIYNGPSQVYYIKQEERIHSALKVDMFFEPHGEKKLFLLYANSKGPISLHCQTVWSLVSAFVVHLQENMHCSPFIMLYLGIMF